MIALRDLAFRMEVGEERDAQMAVLREGDVAPDAVHRQRKRLRAVRVELVEDLVVERQLVGAHGGPIRRIEHEDDGLAAVVAQRDRVPQRALQGESGAWLPAASGGCGGVFEVGGGMLAAGISATASI